MNSKNLFETRSEAGHSEQMKLKNVDIVIYPVIYYFTLPASCEKWGCITAVIYDINVEGIHLTH